MNKAFYLLGLSFVFFYISMNTHVDVLGNNETQKSATWKAGLVFLAGSIFCAMIAAN